MHKIILALVLSLVACSKVAPVAPASPPQNQAEVHARNLSKAVGCAALRTGQAGLEDTAFCDFGRVLAFCHAGVGMGADCTPVVDLRPKAPEQPKAAEAPKLDTNPATEEKPAPSKPTIAKPEPKAKK